MKTIVLSNNKGGCGKTSTALNLSVVLAAKGYQVLAIDLDQQGNLSAALGADLNALDDKGNGLFRKTSYRLLLDESGDFSSYLIEECRPRLDLIPAVPDDEADTLLDGQKVSPDLQLRDRLEPARKVYDYCVIDTPPALRTPTLNALACSDLTIVPIESGMFALLGLSQLLRKIAKVRKAHMPQMLVMALSTMYVGRQTLDRQTREAVIDRFSEDLVFSTTIPRATGVNQATSVRQAVFEVAPESPAAFAFRQLAKEIEEVLHDESEASAASKAKFK